MKACAAKGANQRGEIVLMRYSAAICRVANRYRNEPGDRNYSIGFRVVLSQ